MYIYLAAQQLLNSDIHNYITTQQTEQQFPTLFSIIVIDKISLFIAPSVYRMQYLQRQKDGENDSISVTEE